MPVYQIPYAEIQAPISDAFPAGRRIIRPLLAVTLRNGEKRISCYAIVDSGADHCVFPRSFMHPLGLDPLQAPSAMTTGVGNANVRTLFCNVTLDIDVQQFPAYVGFTDGLEQLGIGLLGQSGFFERFKISFDHANRIFTLETP